MEQKPGKILADDEPTIAHMTIYIYIYIYNYMIVYIYISHESGNGETDARPQRHLKNF